MIYLFNNNSNHWNKYLYSKQITTYSIRVKSLFKAYGAYKGICDFWYQIDDDENISAAVSRYNGVCVVDILKETSQSINEIEIFLKYLEQNSIIFDKKYNLKIKGKYLSGLALKHNAAYFAKEQKNIQTTFNIDLREYYKLFTVNFNKNSTNGFKEFYVDFNHKIRKGTALICGVYKDDNLISACTASYIDDFGAIISGVVTSQNYRKNGYASACVDEITQMLVHNNKEVFLQIDDLTLKKFYNKLGYNEVSCWGEIKRIND